MRWLLVAIAVMIGGCSFPPAAYIQGALTRLDAPSEASAGVPIHLRAHATFSQRYQHPTLNVHLPLDGATTIAVDAVGDWQEPPMGWGVLGRLPFATEVDLEGSLTCDKPGTYILTTNGLTPITVEVR